MRVSPRIMALTLLIALPVMAKPTITFDGKAVVASNITPGSQVAWFSIAWDRWQAMNRVTRRDRIDTDTGAGEVTFTLEGNVPPNSIWVAVDLSSGEYGTASPEGRAVRLEVFPDGWLARGTAGAADVLQADRAFLELLLARPGVGAWGHSVGHGGASDVGDGTDDVTRASVGAMRPIGTTGPTPTRVAPGDIIVLIDPHGLECFATRLAGPR